MHGMEVFEMHLKSERIKMSKDFKVEVIHKETITPSSPTTALLKTLRLSLLDQYISEMYAPMVFFYPNHELTLEHHSLITEKSSILKASLSETLTHFYPFAGEFQYNDSICCDDRGASFIEARVNCRLSEILKCPDADKLECLLPVPILCTQALAGYLVLVQANFFECGGMALAISISHKLADAFTANTFIRSWSAVALGSSSTTDHHLALPGEFGAAASLYPPQDFLNTSKPPVEFTQKGKCTTRRFVFDASQISALKSKAASASVPNPTRVEVVSALIWKCAMEASRANFGSIRPSSWRQAVNLRKRSGQKSSTENLMGNLVWYFEAKTVECELDLQSLVATLRKCKEDYKVNYPNGVTEEDVYQTIKESENYFGDEGTDNYGCTSLCWFPFYETNFGWGKPSWLSLPSLQFKNQVRLMDAKNGNDIEVYLTFLEEDMAIVESNQELLAYASLNPSVF